MIVRVSYSHGLRSAKPGQTERKESPRTTSSSSDETEAVMTNAEIEAEPTVVVRRAMPSDGDAIARMVERCSARTRQRRFLGATAAIPVSYLERICAPPSEDLHLVAVAGSRVVALGSRADDELGLVVEDEWQRAGLGRLLLRRLLEHSPAPLVAEVGDDNAPMLAWLRRLAPRKVAPQRFGWRVVLDPAASLAALGAQLREAA